MGYKSFVKKATLIFTIIFSAIASVSGFLFDDSGQVCEFSEEELQGDSLKFESKIQDQISTNQAKIDSLKDDGDNKDIDYSVMGC